MKKIIKSGVSILLCFVILFGTAPLSGFKDINLSGVIGEIAGWIDGMKLSMSASALELSGQCGTNVYWTFDKDSGTLTISGEGDMYDYSLGTSPFNNIPFQKVVVNDDVTSIGKYAFHYSWNLTSIVLPDSITYIGSYAFNNCTSLTNIIIPNNVSCIEERTFCDCRNLISVALPDSITEIGKSAFSYCTNLVDITIPKRIKKIDEHAFKDVPNIFFDRKETSNLSYVSKSKSPWGAKAVNGYVNDGFVYSNSSMNQLCACQSSVTGDVIIPDSVTQIESNNHSFSSLLIGTGVFSGCYGITSVTIPTSVSRIGKNAFRGVNNITYSDNWYNDVMQGIGSPWGAKAVDAYIEGDLYYYDSSKELLLGCSAEASGTVNIPDSVEEVGENCFSGCDNIKAINFHSPIYFADTAVSNCKNLKTIYASYNTEGDIVYTKPIDDSFSTASVSDKEISRDYDTGILFCQKEASGTYEIPQSVTYICESAFANCINVFVSIPDGVNLKRIGAEAFFNSGNYNDLSNWTNGVLVIGNYIVASEKSISGVFTLPDSIRGIADNAFEKCSSITKLIFGVNSTLRFLGSRAFNGCSSEMKSSLNMPQSLISVGENIFEDTEETDPTEIETLYCGNTLVKVSPDVERFEIKNGTTVIAAGAFSGCTKLNSITVPDTITRIDKNTFKDCIGLKSVAFEGNVTEIGDTAFVSCKSLSEILIPASVDVIGHSAFYGCDGIETFNVANDNKNYKSVDGVLMSKDGKTIIQYPAQKSDSIYSIISGTFVSDLAFYRCRNLEEIVINSNVKYGKRNPFVSCIAGFSFGGIYEDFLYGNTKKTVLKSVSANVTGEFVIPKTVVIIESDAFRECTGITSINFDKAQKIKEIDNYAFYGCTGLTSIVIPNTIETIGKSAFENCSNLKTVEFVCDNDSDYNETLIKIGEYAFCNCPCNTDSGSCNLEILEANDLSIGKNAFKNIFCDSAKITDNGIIYGLNPGLKNLNSIIGIDSDSNRSITCNTKQIGTGSIITVTSNGYLSSYYTVVIFGDVNGDGVYDSTDALIVSCLANGMLTREQVGGALYMASDCNHDGVIDQLDVDILQQAGVLLAEVDQSKSPKELIETSSDYVEYLSMINQEIDKPVDNIPAKEPIQNSPKTLFVFIIEIINAIFKLFIMNIR